MDYQLLNLKTAMPLDTLELHVLARAYYAAWRVMHGTPPQGRHPLPKLEASIEYGKHAEESPKPIPIG